jgi:hypothetical protein
LQVLKGKHIKYKFEELAVHFEQGLGDISYHKFDISDEVKEQVNIHYCKFFFFFLFFFWLENKAKTNKGKNKQKLQEEK